MVLADDEEIDAGGAELGLLEVDFNCDDVCVEAERFIDAECLTAGYRIVEGDGGFELIAEIVDDGNV